MSEENLSFYLPTIEQLKKRTRAYDGFVTVADSDIPDYYKQVFPHTCACGSEMILDKHNYTRLQCCNPECYIKWGYKLSHFLSYLGYKGFGDTTCSTLIQATKDKFIYRSFLSVFLIPEVEIAKAIGPAQYDAFVDIKRHLASRLLWFNDAITSLGIQDIGRSSRLFEVVSSPQPLITALLEDNTDTLMDICHIQDQMARWGLKSAKIDIFVLFSKVLGGIKAMPKHQIHVAITGSVSVKGKPYSRREFITLCESILDESGQPVFKLKETKAEAKLEYVIADVPSSSEKYNLGKRLGLLVTADEFYNKLMEMSLCGNVKSEEVATDG